MRSFVPDASTRVLVIAPHPDDESIACGGLIQRTLAAGGVVRVLFVTNGDDNPWPQRVLERRVFIGAAARSKWGTRRRGEAHRAIATLGLAADDIAFAGLPDRSLTQRLLTGDRLLADLLSREMDAFLPTVIVLPSVADTHADHSAIGVIARLELHRRREAAGESPVLLEYLVHGRMKPSPADTISVDLTPPQVRAKREAIGCHTSQTALSGGRFFAYATECETYVDPSAADESHGVQSATRESNGWRITLGARRWFDRPSRAWLNVIARTGDTLLARRVELFGRLAVLDVSGQPLGNARRDADGLHLPHDALPVEAATLYVKRSGGLAFFDEAGWKPIDESPAWKRVEAGDRSLTMR